MTLTMLMILIFTKVILAKQKREKNELDKHHTTSVDQEHETQVKFQYKALSGQRVSPGRYDGVISREKFTFFALRPDSKYEVRLRAKNEEGWSEAAKEFIFTTPK